MRKRMYRVPAQGREVQKVSDASSTEVSLFPFFLLLRHPRTYFPSQKAALSSSHTYSHTCNNYTVLPINFFLLSLLHSEEIARVHSYLSPSSEGRLVEVVERQLLEGPMRTLLEMEHSGLVALLRDDKLEDLQRLYTLYR
jgi:hypothetical protein